MILVPDLQNRVALEPGASRGIGAAIALALAEAGAAVAVNYRLRAEDSETVVVPSLIETDMMRARRDEVVPRIPLGRMGHPEEVAQAVLMVIGNPYMTGQTIQLNGGSNFI